MDFFSRAGRYYDFFAQYWSSQRPSIRCRICAEYYWQGGGGGGGVGDSGGGGGDDGGGSTQ